MKIALASDHGGYHLKEAVKRHLSFAHEIKDFGCYGTESCDYPDYGAEAARAVADGTCDYGILVCTTGIGISIAANKIKGIRCALCTDSFSAKMTRLHNDANVLALGAGIVGELFALDIVDTFLGTAFSNGENHVRRVSKLEKLDGDIGPALSPTAKTLTH